MRRLPLTAAALLLAALTRANGIELSAFPRRSVADGRSTANVTAVVRDSNGRAVPDGTRVFFATTLGSFREAVVTTRGGLANATLVAGGIPGFARITATALTGNSAPATLDFEFVKDRKLLSNADEYVEIFAPGTMVYAADVKIIAVSGLGRDKPVRLRYRDVTITAEDVQLDVRGFSLRARRARLKMGKIDQDFEELSLKLNGRRGQGTTTFTAIKPEAASFDGKRVRFYDVTPQETLEPARPVERFGVVDIAGDSFHPSTTPLSTGVFDFEDLSTSPSTIRAKKAVVFPSRGIQFQKAEMWVGEIKVLAMPLYELNSLYSDSPVVTDQLVQMRDNQIALNYPYYTKVAPGQTNLFRLRTGDAQGRSVGGSRGVLLDYEMNWNRGDEMDGGLVFSGIGRDDWNASLRQFLQMGDRTRINLQVQSPAGESVFGSLNVSQQHPGFGLSFNANMTRNLRGLRYDGQDYSLALEKDPTKLGNLPARLYYGVAATYSRRSFLGTEAVQNVGLFTRLQTDPLRLDRASTLTFSSTVIQNTGDRSRSPVSLLASASLFRRISSSAQLTATYDFRQDGIEDAILGHHYLSLDGSYYSGRTGATLQVGRSLDADRFSVFGDLSYRVSPSWRLGYSYTLDQFLDNSYLDQSITLGYRLGWREIGLVYSTRLKRIGFQILGVNAF